MSEASLILEKTGHVSFTTTTSAACRGMSGIRACIWAE